ncbi:hypothetical protein OIU78_004154 [Salix suchowensis]|nr:hypothetical protein OIU78_004154 [Salix suchowensis]
MKPKPAIVVYFVISLILSLPLLFFFFFCFKTNTYTPPDENPISGLRIRPGYTTYKTYIQRQLNKTLNPKLRKIWTTRDWDRKIQVFADFFQVLKQKNLLFNESKALCIGARVGQEVEALRRIGVSDSVGMDLVPYPPLVVKG